MVTRAQECMMTSSLVLCLSGLSKFA